MDEEDCRLFVSILLEQNANRMRFSIYLPDAKIANSVKTEFEARGLKVAIDAASGKVTIKR